MVGVVVVVVVVVCAAVQVGWRGVPRRNWPGGGSGTDPSGGIASPVGGGRDRYQDSSIYLNSFICRPRIFTVL